MVDAGQQRAEHLAVVDDAADRGAAKADAVIAALAADQADAAALAVDLVIGQRDLERGVGGLRAGIAEEHVVEPGGRQIGDAAGEFEGLRDAELERRRVIQRLGLLARSPTKSGCGRGRRCSTTCPAAPSMILRPSTVM